MIVMNIFVPFLALVSSFRNTALDDLRAPRSDPRALAPRHNGRGTLSSFFLASIVISHHLLRAEMYGYALDREDATATRPPAYVEERISRPYTSTLLRTTCIAQKIPVPPAPTCINKAVQPSFEYAAKSPAPPAFPVHRQTCSLKDMPVFIDVDMTRPSNLFPESAYSTPGHGSSNTPIAVVIAVLVELARLLATFISLTMVWVGVVTIIIYKPSVYAPTLDLIQQVEGIGPGSVAPIPESESGQSEGIKDNGSKRSDEVLASDCQSEESPKEMVSRPPMSLVFEPSTPSNRNSSIQVGSPVVPSVVFEVPILSSTISPLLSAHLDSDDLPEFVVGPSSTATTALGLVTPLPPSLPSNTESIPSISLDSSLSAAVCKSSPLPVQYICSQGSPVFSPIVSGPPLLLVQDLAPSSFGSSVLTPIIVGSNIPNPVAEAVVPDAKPPSVALHTLAHTASMLAPYSLRSSIHAPTFHPIVTVTTHVPTLNPAADVSTPRSLGSSVHAPAFQPILSTFGAPESPKPVTRPTLNPAAQPFLSRLGSSMHAPISQPALSPTSEHRPALNPGARPFLSRLSSSMHAPIPQPHISPLRASERHLALNPTAQPFLSGLLSSVHAPVPPPRALEHRPALNHAARPFLPVVPEFFVQAHSARVAVVAPPPKKRRVRSPQMKERKAAQRAAREAAAAAGSGEADEAHAGGEGGGGEA